MELTKINLLSIQREIWKFANSYLSKPVLLLLLLEHSIILYSKFNPKWHIFIVKERNKFSLDLWIISVNHKFHYEIESRKNSLYAKVREMKYCNKQLSKGN